MKTTSFGSINVEYEGDICLLTISSPMDGKVTVSMSPDELMMLLVEIGNGLSTGRAEELKRRIEQELKRELNR